MHVLLFVLALFVLVFSILVRHLFRLCFFYLCLVSPHHSSFMFMYCIKVRCVVFFLDFRFAFLLSYSSGRVCSLSFLFPLFRCTSLGLLCFRSVRSPLACRFMCVFIRPTSVCSCPSSVVVLSSPVSLLCLLSMSRGWPLGVQFSVVPRLLLISTNSVKYKSLCWYLPKYCSHRYPTIRQDFPNPYK